LEKEIASLFCGNGSRQPLLKAPTTTLHRSRVSMTPTGRFILRCTYLHTWSSIITPIIVVIELNLVAFIQNKIAKQLSWLLNQIVEATQIKPTELDLQVSV